MPRRGAPELRQISPDPIFGSVLVQKLINRVMVDGKKTVAESIVYGALGRIADQTGENPLEVLQQAFNNIMPAIEVRPRRVGGQTYQVPMEVTVRRKLTLALRWLVNAARARPERGMMAQLAGEILAAARGEGDAVKKRDDTHRMAEANKAFAHYRW